MQPKVPSFSYPMNLPLIGIQLAGYWLETNLRVAQVFSRAAIEACPGVGNDMTSSTTVAAAALGTSEAASNPKPVKPKARKTTPVSAAPEIPMQISKNSAKQRPAKALTVQPAPTKTKRQRKPSAPPPMPTAPRKG